MTLRCIVRTMQTGQDNMQVNSFEQKKQHLNTEGLICIQMHVNPASLEEAGKPFVMNWLILGYTYS